ncbi:hypothetical protein OE88DRAFT_1643631 [Heliocybe sulcata]|uniref:Uncharacterized protein n=1 Tax=Heliocybe sulcata TaxID=5364 RepID=A0A5C3N8X4_9AGAM|nr:hypothetical protein OE88DRAFT_1643631 [Heliocybe sulcata]
MGASASKNVQVAGIGNVVQVVTRAGGAIHPNAYILRVYNDSTESASIEILTPGGQIGIVEKTNIEPSTPEDFYVLKATYDIVIRSAGTAKTISNVSLLGDNGPAVFVSKLLSGDISGSTLAIDAGAKPVSKDALIKDFYSGDAVKAAVELGSCAPEDKLVEAIARFRGRAN